MPKREETSVEKSKEAPSERWADQAEDGEEVNWDEEGGERVVSQEKLPDGSVLKTVVEYTTNDKGQSIKITKRVKQHKVPIKINRRVESRKKWRKFGECAGRVGIETGVTMMSADDVYLELTDQAKKEIEPSLLENSQKKKELLGFMVCRICGKVGDHWTLNCPLKGKIGAPTGGANSERAPVASSKDRYVPPSIRTRGTTGSTVESSGPRERVEATLRVSNLSEEARDSDVSELFRPFGAVSRIYLAKDKNGKSKGFAFVTFIHRDQAERALNKLNGFGYDHLILHVEWAKPSRD